MIAANIPCAPSQSNGITFSTCMGLSSTSMDVFKGKTNKKDINAIIMAEKGSLLKLFAKLYETATNIKSAIKLVVIVTGYPRI
ncbi:hypothetical protein D3C74_361820 [compost metagenome]